jgi:putative transcriptional regulator
MINVTICLEVKHVNKNLRFKSARALKDMSQKDVAEAVGVTRQTINAIENGDYNPSIQLCIAICKVFGKTLDQIFWEDESNE